MSLLSTVQFLQYFFLFLSRSLFNCPYSQFLQSYFIQNPSISKIIIPLRVRVNFLSLCVSKRKIRISPNLYTKNFVYNQISVYIASQYFLRHFLAFFCLLKCWKICRIFHPFLIFSCPTKYFIHILFFLPLSLGAGNFERHSRGLHPADRLTARIMQLVVDVKFSPD